MSYSDFEEEVMDKLVAALGGDSQQGHISVGRELPKLHAWDLTTLLTQFSASVVHAVTSNNGQGVALVGAYGGGGGVAGRMDPNRIPEAVLVDAASGSFTGDAGELSDVNKGSRSVTAAEYVAGGPHEGDPAWVRYIAPADADTYYVPQSYEACSNIAASDGGQGYIGFIRQMLTDWQACVDIAATTIGVNYGANVELDAPTVESFHMALGKLAVDLDVLAETPPSTYSFRESWSHAVDKTEAALVDIGNAAGKTAAELGNVVGKVAGSAAGGFFSQATLLTLGVAGVAVFVLVR